MTNELKPCPCNGENLDRLCAAIADVVRALGDVCKVLNDMQAAKEKQ